MVSSKVRKNLNQSFFYTNVPPIECSRATQDRSIPMNEKEGDRK